MSRPIYLMVVLPLLSGVLMAQDADNADDAAPANESAVEAEAPAKGTSPDQPRTMSGMSILGNEEAPKSLVIVPWKSSELGNEISLNDSLDERARPVDKDVFERELRYFAIRSGNQDQR